MVDRRRAQIDPVPGPQPANIPTLFGSRVGLIGLLAASLTYSSLASASLAQEAWSPLRVEDRIAILFTGEADVPNRRLRLVYEVRNVSREDVDLVIIDPIGGKQRQEIMIPAEGVQTLSFDGRLEVQSLTSATHGLEFSTYLQIGRETDSGKVLVPREVIMFSLNLRLPEGARIVRSSIPKEIVLGEPLMDRRLRALPAVKVVYSTAAEQIDVSYEVASGEYGEMDLVVRVRNAGIRRVKGLTVSTRIDLDLYTPDPALTDGDILEMDQVKSQWMARLADLKPGTEKTITLHLISRAGPVWGADILVHNLRGDLVAVAK